MGRLSSGTPIRLLRLLLLADGHIRITRHFSVVTTAIDVTTNIGSDDNLLFVVSGAIYGIPCCLSIFVWATFRSFTRTRIVVSHTIAYCNRPYLILLSQCTYVDIRISYDFSSITTTKDIVDGTDLTTRMRRDRITTRRIPRFSFSNNSTIFNSLIFRNHRISIRSKFTFHYIDIHRRTTHHNSTSTITCAIDITDTGKRLHVHLRIIKQWCIT